MRISPVNEAIVLDPEDSATAMVCVELVDPQLVERSVDLMFNHSAIDMEGIVCYVVTSEVFHNSIAMIGLHFALLL